MLFANNQPLLSKTSCFVSCIWKIYKKILSLIYQKS